MENNDNSAPKGTNNELLVDLFHKAAKGMMRMHHHQGHAEHAQRRVLMILQHSSPINQSDMLEIVNVRSTSLSELLGKLENRGLITRSRSEQDKRTIIITLTEQGSAVAASFKDARQQSFNAIFAALSADECGQLTALLHKVTDSMEQYGPTHGCRHGRCQKGDHEGRHNRAHGRCLNGDHEGQHNHAHGRCQKGDHEGQHNHAHGHCQKGDHEGRHNHAHGRCLNGDHENRCHPLHPYGDDGATGCSERKQPLLPDESSNGCVAGCKQRDHNDA